MTEVVTNGGRTITLEMWSLMEGKWACYRDGQFSKGECTCYGGGLFNGGRMVILQRWSD